MKPKPTAKQIRNGKGHRAYRRQQAALKRRTKQHNLPCGYGSPTGEGCGQPINTELPDGHRLSFTADHPEAINAGGKLLGQQLVPMHRSCNSRKNDGIITEIWHAT